MGVHLSTTRTKQLGNSALNDTDIFVCVILDSKAFTVCFVWTHLLGHGAGVSSDWWAYHGNTGKTKLLWITWWRRWFRFAKCLRRTNLLKSLPRGIQTLSKLFQGTSVWCTNNSFNWGVARKLSSSINRSGLLCKYNCFSGRPVRVWCIYVTPANVRLGVWVCAIAWVEMAMDSEWKEAMTVM